MSRSRILYSSKSVQLTTPSLSSRALNGVQSATYGFELARTDVNAFGKLAAHARLLTTTPTVTAELQTLAHSGQGVISQADIMTNASQSTVTIGLDTLHDDDSNFATSSTHPSTSAVTWYSPSKINVQGAFVSAATAEASVGAFALLTVGFEGTGINNQGTVAVPGVATASPQNRVYVVFPTVTDETNDPTTTWNEAADFNAEAQSANMTVNITREVLEKFGRLFSDQRLIQFPSTASMTLEGLDLNNQVGFANMASYQENTQDLKFIIDCNLYGLKGASVDSITFNGGIGDNHTVSVAMSSSIGSIDDTSRNFVWHDPKGIGGAWGEMYCEAVA